MKYHNPEVFEPLESNFGDINSQRDLHELVENIYGYLDELTKQKDLNSIEDVLEEVQDRQDFLDDTINFVGQAIAYSAKRLDEKQFLTAYKQAMFKFKLTRYSNKVEYRSKFDDEKLTDLPIKDENYVIVKGTTLVRPSFDDIRQFFDDYLSRV